MAAANNPTAVLCFCYRCYCRRYRLLLRSGDQQFFVDNFIASYLPTRYSLSTQLDGPANSTSNYHEAQAAATAATAATAVAGHSLQQQPQQRLAAGGGAAVAVPASSQQQQQQGVPLSNETWWRLYCAGDVLACYLASAMQQGLNLQVCNARCSVAMCSNNVASS
jgi:1,6-anhydro-N-acetylmuramate kinase